MASSFQTSISALPYNASTIYTTVGPASGMWFNTTNYWRSNFPYNSSFYAATRGNDCHLSIASDHALRYGYYEDGNPWIYVPPTKTIKIAKQNDSVSIVGMLNVSGGLSSQPFNGTYQNYIPYNSTSAINFNSTSVYFSGNDSIIFYLYPYWGQSDDIPTLPVIYDTAVNNTATNHPSPAWVLSLVSSIPPSGSFRPSPFGNKNNRRYFSESNIDWTKLPNGFTRNRFAAYSQTNPYPTESPTYDELIRLVNTFGGDINFIYNTSGNALSSSYLANDYFLNPANKLPSTDISVVLSDALLKLMESPSGLPDIENRKKLARAVIQRGIDAYGSFRSGRTESIYAGTELGGGGLKAAIIFAGHMLNDSEMINPDASLSAYPAAFGSAATLSSFGRFAENHLFYETTATKATYYGSRWGTRFNTLGIQSSSASSLIDNWYYLDLSTSLSVDPSRRLEFAHFGLSQAKYAGAVLAMLMIGRSKEYGKAAIGAVTDHFYWWHVHPTFGGRYNSRNTLDALNYGFFIFPGNSIRAGNGAFTSRSATRSFNYQSLGVPTLYGTPGNFAIPLPGYNGFNGFNSSGRKSALFPGDNWAKYVWDDIRFKDYCGGPSGIVQYLGIYENLQRPTNVSAGGGYLICHDNGLETSTINLELYDAPRPFETVTNGSGTLLIGEAYPSPIYSNPGQGSSSPLEYVSPTGFYANQILFTANDYGLKRFTISVSRDTSPVPQRYLYAQVRYFLADGSIANSNAVKIRLI